MQLDRSLVDRAEGVERPLAEDAGIVEPAIAVECARSRPSPPRSARNRPARGFPAGVRVASVLGTTDVPRCDRPAENHLGGSAAVKPGEVADGGMFEHRLAGIGHSDRESTTVPQAARTP